MLSLLIHKTWVFSVFKKSFSSNTKLAPMSLTVSGHNHKYWTSMNIYWHESNTPVTNAITLYFSALLSCQNNLECLSLLSILAKCSIWGVARLTAMHYVDRLVALLENIRLDWKYLKWRNTLAYFYKITIIKKKVS